MQNYGKSSKAHVDMPDLQTKTHYVCVTKRTTRLRKSTGTLNKTNPNGEPPMAHPEFVNPPGTIAHYTDEDYALVCNVWRRELGLEPLV